MPVHEDPPPNVPVNLALLLRLATKLQLQVWELTRCLAERALSAQNNPHAQYKGGCDKRGGAPHKRYFGGFVVHHGRKGDESAPSEGSPEPLGCLPLTEHIAIKDACSDKTCD